jgi:D-sedoheptulose 7-phosphate isomerase
MSLKLIESSLEEHRDALDRVAAIAEDIVLCADRMSHVLATGGCIYICGNGGSAGDSQHFAAELTNRFEKNRKGYPAIALTTDTSALTSIGNDFGFEFVFSRQLEALAQAGDMLIAISTSGNSANVLRAVESARERDVFTVGLLGGDGGALAGQVDLALIVGSFRTARIQEAHIFILHVLCEIFEAQL